MSQKVCCTTPIITKLQLLQRFWFFGQVYFLHLGHPKCFNFAEQYKMKAKTIQIALLFDLI